MAASPQEHPLVLTRAGAVARLRLDRPALHNAFDAGLIAALTATLDQVAADDAVRAVVLEGSGASFSAGADLNWMRGMASASEAANRDDALALARLMRTLDELRKPTLARVHGAAFGGGVGLVACCDIAIGVPEAKFGLTESKLGLLPAVISPYVIAAIGPREARRWFATAEIFDAATALRIGLLHEVVAAETLDALTVPLSRPRFSAAGSYILSICASSRGSISMWISSGLCCSSTKMPTSGITNSAQATHIAPAWLRTVVGKSANRNSSTRCQRGAGVRYSRLWPRCISCCSCSTSCGL